MKGTTQQLPKFAGRLNPLEWAVVLLIPLSVVVSIRFLALFYIGLAVLGLLAVYGLVAAWDYHQYLKLKRRNKRKKVTTKFHFSQTVGFGLLGLLLAVIYLSF